MARDERIKSCMNAYKGFDRTKLLLLKERYTPESDEHRSAVLLIDDMDRKERAQEKKEEGNRHRESVRVAKVGYLIAGVAAAAAIASAWYARSQAESAALSALSARASAASIVSPPASPAPLQSAPTAAPAASSAPATPKL